MEKQKKFQTTNQKFINPDELTMVLEYESPQNWAIEMGYVCRDSYSSTMVRIWEIIQHDLGTLKLFTNLN